MPKRRTVPCDVSSLALWQCEAAYDRLVRDPDYNPEYYGEFKPVKV